jgi:tRNA A-37 threonylcarbamoyl transferase component Bud32
MTVEAGTRLNDRYRLGSRIATGGMGEVWRARDELLDRDVAVKMLKHEYADDESFLERFRAEARHTAGLAHPGIAGVFDYGEAEGTAYLVMELVPGDPLNAVLRAEGRLSPDRTLDLVAQVARALDVAHQGGVIHRDVKPGNVLVCPDGTVKVTDFGIARAADAVPLTQTGVVMGSAHYIAPEQANGGEVTYASDVYSLGVMAYECLAGHRPFDADTPVGLAMAHLYEDPVALPEDVPPAVSQLVAQAMAKDPAERFVSAAAFAQAADAVRSGLLGATEAMPAVTAAAPVGATMALPVVEDVPPVAGEHRRRPAWLVAAVLGGLALVLGVAGWAALRPAPETKVPSLRGMTKAQATAALDRRHLDLTTQLAYHDSVERGLVVKQSPAPGAVVREGDDVSVTISRGPQPVALPGGLSGKPVDEVAATLEGLGLKVRRIGTVSGAPFGTVLSVTPESGLRKGDTATVTFSFGPPRREEPKGEGKKKGDRR